MRKGFMPAICRQRAASFSATRGTSLIARAPRHGKASIDLQRSAGASWGRRWQRSCRALPQSSTAASFVGASKYGIVKGRRFDDRRRSSSPPAVRASQDGREPSVEPASQPARRLFSALNPGTLRHEPGSVLGAAALVAGTTVGAGILALPYATQVRSPMPTIKGGGGGSFPSRLRAIGFDKVNQEGDVQLALAATRSRGVLTHSTPSGTRAVAMLQDRESSEEVLVFKDSVGAPRLSVADPAQVITHMAGLKCLILERRATL